MRSWAIILSGLLVWAFHFFALYGIGEFGGSGRAARVAIGLLSIACLVAIAALGVGLARRPRHDAPSGWRTQLGLTGLALGAIAVAWQTLPMFLAR